MKAAAKGLMTALAVLLSFPLALLSGFGRIHAGFMFGGHSLSLVPGLPGDYLRVAFYWMTLKSCSLQCRISFGAFFSNPGASIEPGAYIGPNCILGRASVGRNAQIASAVQILSGQRQHTRDDQGNILGSHEGEFKAVRIGANAWIGAAAIVMADVGDRTTIGAGSVVTKPVPAGTVAVGNPARVIRDSTAAATPLSSGL
jgi:virginiamycin A acetyltransferase